MVSWNSQCHMACDECVNYAFSNVCYSMDFSSACTKSLSWIEPVWAISFVQLYKSISARLSDNTV